MELDRSHVRKWKHLADAFLKQYKYNLDTAPDGMGLQSMEKKSTETFKEDAQGWIKMAAQVLPPLTEKEMVATFLTTLPFPFYDRMVGNLSTHFAALVMIGEKIEQGVKSGQIVWRKLVVALRLRFPTIKQDYEGMDAGEGHSPSVSPLSLVCVHSKEVGHGQSPSQ